MQYNTAFVDEAIYATIGEEVLRKIYWESGLSWMGGSYLYPIISALLNRYWGLEGIRIFSTLCVLTTAIISGKIARQLRGAYSEIITVGLFLFSSITLNLGQLGTYDAPSLVFSSIAVYLALKSRYSYDLSRVRLLILSSIFMTLAILSKYVALFFLPAIALFIAIKGRTLHDLKKNLLIGIRSGIIWLSVPMMVLTWYVTSNFDQVSNFFTGTHFSEPSSFVKISNQIVSSTHIILFTATAAFLYALSKVKGEKKLIIGFLFFGGWLPILYHFTSLNIRSLPKHMVFTLFYWTPLSGWLGNKIISSLRSMTTKAMLANSAQFLTTGIALLLIANLWFSFSNHWRFQRSWPSATGAIEYLEKHRKSGDKILAEGAAVFKYHLFDGFEDPASWPSTWYFNYEGLNGTEAIKKAVEDQSFDYIVLNGYFTSYVNSEIEPVINEHYNLVVEDTYKVSGVHDHTTKVWEPKERGDIADLSIDK